MNKLAELFVCLLSFVVALLFLCAARTLVLTLTRSEPPSPCKQNENEGYISADDAWPRFKGALKFRTESFGPHRYNRTELKNLVNFLIKSYPAIIQCPFVTHDVINDYSLLISVQGQNSKLKPYMLTAHLDVVPVIQDEWTYDGFGATESEDGSMIYARGAIDDKGSLMGQLEALNFMISRGVQPQRGFYLAYGHDEEVGGEDGAAHVAKELRKRGVSELAFLVDEGIPVVEGLFPGCDKNLVGFGVSEKGSLTLNLSVHMEGGHSSMPKKQTSIGVLSSALAKLENNPHEIIFDEMVKKLVEKMSLHFTFPTNVIASNMWLFQPLVARSFEKGAAEGLIRTTTAVTMFRGGIKSNVIPPTAWAIVNHRIHPKQTIAEIIKKDAEIINDERVNITFLRGYEPHPVSPHGGDNDRPYQIVEKTMLQIFPEAIPAPVPLIANTDTQHYLGFTKHIFRLMPFTLHAKTELHRVHGRDERLSKKNFESAMNFFYHLMLNADEDDKTKGSHSHSSEL